MHELGDSMQYMNELIKCFSYTCGLLVVTFILAQLHVVDLFNAVGTFFVGAVFLVGAPLALVGCLITWIRSL